MGKKTTRIIEKPLPRNEEGIVDKQFLRDHALFMLANIAYTEGRKDRAREMIERALPTVTTPDANKAIRRMQGSFLTDEDKTDEARSLLEQLLAEETDHLGKAKTLLVLARNSLKRKEQRQAIDYLTRALEEETETITQGQTNRLLAHAYLDLNDYDKASQHIKKTLELAELCGLKMEHARATQILGQILRQQGKYEESEKEYRTASEEFLKLGTLDDYAGAMYGIAKCQEKQGKTAEAIETCEQTLTTIRPKLPKGKRGLTNDLMNLYADLLKETDPQKAKQIATEGRLYSIEIYGTEHTKTREYEQLRANAETRILSAKIGEKAEEKIKEKIN